MNRLPTSTWLARALIRAAVVACAASVLGVGVFDIDDSWAKTRTVTMSCTGESAQDAQKVTLKPGEDAVSFSVHYCVCDTSAEKLKQQILSGVDPGRYTSEARKIGPGETITLTLYCYTDRMFREFIPGDN